MWYWFNSGRTVRSALLAICCVTLLACSAPTEKANSYYQKGLALLAQGDLLKARIELQNALQIKPDHTAALFALAQIAEQQGDWQQLIRLLSKVVDHEPRHLEAQVKLGRMLLAAGRIDQARAAIDAAFDIAPENADVLGLRAGLLYKLDDIPGALLQAHAALALNPSNIDGLVVLMTERLAVNAGPQALEYLDRALRVSDKHLALQLINPQVVDALAQADSGEAVLSRLIAFYPEMRALRPALAQFYQLHGRADAAEVEYRTIAAEHPSEVQLRLDLVRFVATSRGPKAAQQLLRELIASDAANSELNFALVTMLQAQGDQQAAEALLRSIMERSGSSPDGIKAKALLAGVLFSNGSKEAVQALLREVLAGDKRNEEGLLLKARLAIDEHQIDQAIADIRSILHDSPNSPRALLLQARAYEVSGAFALAQESYLRAYEAGRPAAQFAQAYAEFLLRRGQAARAESVANGILRLEPLYAPALRLLAQAQISQGDWVGAQKVAEQLSALAEQQVLAEQVRGELFAARKEYAQSIAAFRRAYAAAPLEVQSMVALARAYVTAGKAPEAIAFLNSVVKNDPENISALLILGELQVAKGDSAAAARSFQTVIELQPQQAQGYLNLAGVKVRAGHGAEAQQIVEQGLLKAPGNFSLRMARADTFALSGDFAEAIRQYQTLLDDHPDAGEAVNSLARLLSEDVTNQASLARAYKLAERFRGSDVATYKDTLGWAGYRLGKFDEAAKLLASAVKQAPEQAVLRYHLGMIYAAQNKPQQARKELEKALELAQGADFAQLDAVREALLKL